MAEGTPLNLSAERRKVILLDRPGAKRGERLRVSHIIPRDFRSDCVRRKMGSASFFAECGRL